MLVSVWKTLRQQIAIIAGRECESEQRTQLIMKINSTVDVRCASPQWTSTINVVHFLNIAVLYAWRSTLHGVMDGSNTKREANTEYWEHREQCERCEESRGRAYTRTPCVRKMHIRYGCQSSVCGRFCWTHFFIVYGLRYGLVSNQAGSALIVSIHIRSHCSGLLQQPHTNSARRVQPNSCKILGAPSDRIHFQLIKRITHSTRR